MDAERLPDVAASGNRERPPGLIRQFAGAFASQRSRKSDLPASSAIQPASDQNISEDDCLGGDGGNPVSPSPAILAAVEKLETERNLPAFGRYGLDLGRTYRSFDTKAKMFLPKWRSSCGHWA